jgi:hypothetical protein
MILGETDGFVKPLGLLWVLLLFAALLFVRTRDLDITVRCENQRQKQNTIFNRRTVNQKRNQEQGLMSGKNQRWTYAAAPTPQRLMIGLSMQFDCAKVTRKTDVRSTRFFLVLYLVLVLSCNISRSTVVLCV